MGFWGFGVLGFWGRRRVLFSKKEREKEKLCRHKKNTNIITNLKAASFGSLGSSFFNEEARFFISLGV